MSGSLDSFDQQPQSEQPIKPIPSIPADTSLPTPPPNQDQVDHDTVVSDLQAILDAAPPPPPQPHANGINGGNENGVEAMLVEQEQQEAPAVVEVEVQSEQLPLESTPVPAPSPSAPAPAPVQEVAEEVTMAEPSESLPPPPVPSVIESAPAPVSISAPIPPPILPLPSHIDIPNPTIKAPDSTSSLNVEPPTPAPLLPNSTATSTVHTPAAATEDVQMQLTTEPITLKRSAPEDEDLVPAGTMSNGMSTPGSVGEGLTTEEERETKRQKVEEAVAEPSPAPYTPPILSSAAPTASPSPAPVAAVSPAPIPIPQAAASPAPQQPVVAAPPVPSAGYDPSAFISAPTPPLIPVPSSAALIPPPTMSPNDLHLPPGASPLASTSTSVAPPADATAARTSGPVAVLTKAQHHYGGTILRSLKNNRNVGPFQNPVDYVALLIPDYPKVITRPIDLGTIENKLKATGKAITASAKVGRVFGMDYSGVGQWEGMNEGVYRTAQEFIEDVGRVWENCYKYNGPKDKNPVSAMAATLQEIAEKMLKKMPVSVPVEYVPEPPRLPSPEMKKERRPSQSFVPTIRRSEETSRPKREIHAPARELPYEEGGKRQRGVSGKAAQEQLRYCKEVIKELFKKVHEPYAYVFYEPVNYVALNLPTYPSIVKKPMDLGTIRQKLDNNAYPMPPYVPFEADVRLVFKNCYLFNPSGTPVHEWGRKVEAVFDAKWDERPTGEDEDDESDDELTMMERRMQQMQAELEAMRQKKAAGKADKLVPAPSVKPPKPAKRPSIGGASGGRNSMGSAGKKKVGGSGKKGGKGRKRRDSDDDDDMEDYEAPIVHHRAAAEPEQVSYDMKRELAVKISAFEGENLEKAIDIIRNGRPDLLSDANKEIELDIDQLDQRTLLSLYKFVCPKPVRAKPGPAKGGRVATGGTKRKNLDEIKESERIEMLEARLRDFENGGAKEKQVEMNEQASSEEESSEESGSESEED